MLPTKGLYKCFPKLLMAKENLENLCKDELKLSLDVLKHGIVSLKKLLKEVDREALRYVMEGAKERDVKTKNLDEVYQAMNEVDNVLLPDDYSLDILLFNLLKEEEDELVNDENISYKDVIELLMQQDKAKSIDEKDCENEETSMSK